MRARRGLASIAAAVWLSWAPTPAQADDDCAALAGLKIENANLLSARVVAAEGDLPEYCRVLGYVRPAINFEVRLPTTGWNGKLYSVGCGGYCGRLQSDRPGFINAMNHGLKRNYAAVVTDSGHWGANSSDARWAYNNPVARADWGWRSAGEATRVARALAEEYYSRPLERSYFAGCSTGGRQAHMAATRYPDQFDGIISGSPAIYDGSRWFTFRAWFTKANTNSQGKPILKSDKVPLIQKAVHDACAGPDGLIDDPRSCAFDPADLQCTASSGADCLSAEQVAVVKKFYQGPRDSSGRPLYAGMPLGSEAYWGFWILGADDAEWFANKRSLQNELRYFGFDQDPGPDYDVLSFDFDRDPGRLAHDVDKYVVADATDLSAFWDRGGKLLIYQGWADVVVLPQPILGWYEAMAGDMGGLLEASKFARLFMLPGMDHCGFLNSGPGVHHTGFDPLVALEKWVEQGVPPDRILMTKRSDDGKIVWARPVCAVPNMAAHDGFGPVDQATSYRCVRR